MGDAKYALGLDFGTDSVRSIIINVDNGEEVATSVSYYRRWGEGKYSDPVKNQFRHHPLDYLESLEGSVLGAIRKAKQNISGKIIGIGIDTTGSTLAPVDKNGIVLSLKEEYAQNPDAMFVLWKDHTAIKEAELINEIARSWGGTDYTKYVGGVYSSEWFWAKVLHILREDKKVREAAYSWVELADWIPAILTSNIDPLKMKRSRCAAGHKAMWHESWGGLPSEEFLSRIDPLLSGLRERLYSKTYTSDISAGGLSADWADRFNLDEGIAVTVGAFDPHMGAVGAQIRDKTFVKVIGTSCCDMVVSSREKVKDSTVEGICGQVDGSILPGLIGFEAGQSSFGDVYAWFKNILLWPTKKLLLSSRMLDPDTLEKLSDEIENNLIEKLSEEASKIDPGDTGLVALDWLNGRRTPYADQKLKGAIMGLTLGTTTPGIFRALVEATAFGSMAIIDRFTESNIEIEEVVAIGGIPQKSPLVMQILSDVMNMPVKVARSTQSVALGAAIFAAVASGCYDTVYDAQKKMSSGFLKTYYPDKNNTRTYKGLYQKYIKFGNSIEEQLRSL